MIQDQVQGFTLLEPSCGSGTFVRSLSKTFPDVPVFAVDPNKKHEKGVYEAGAHMFHCQKLETWEPPQSLNGSRVISVGNPPFSLAQKHLEVLFKKLPVTSYVAFLLRLSFWSGYDRTRSFWDFQGLPYLKHFAPITPRPSFVKGKNDNSEYGLFVWKVGNTEPAIIHPAITWEK